jgi:hypothetical protein
MSTAHQSALGSAPASAAADIVPGEASVAGPPQAASSKLTTHNRTLRFLMPRRGSIFTLSPLLSTERLSVERNQGIVPDSSSRTKGDIASGESRHSRKLLNTDDEFTN